MRKVLQNTLFAAMTAWAIYGLVDSVPDTLGASKAKAASYSSHWQR